MKKAELLRRIAALPYDPAEYWLLSGGAMVLYGFRPETHDIDLGCSAALADRLEAQGLPCRRTGEGRRCFRPAPDLELFEDWLEDRVCFRDGVPVVSVRGLAAMKRRLGRDKDLRDLALIRAREPRALDRISSWDSPLGQILLSADGDALTGLCFAGQAHAPEGLVPEPGAEALPVFVRTRLWLEQYFAGLAPALPPALAPQGTAFQLRVWERLVRIPRGETLSYGELASELGCPSARAVGAAVGRNPISLLIPCHRVLGSGGRLTGYAGGLWRKEALLRLEGVLPPAEKEVLSWK